MIDKSQMFLILLILIPLMGACQAKEISKSQMKVKWEIIDQQLQVEMIAPTDSWVAIGFNESSSLAGTYFLMGHVENDKAEIVEFYIERPGLYRPLTDYGIPSEVLSVEGEELGRWTRLKFALPIHKVSKYRKKLSLDSTWTMLLAYSLEDDFKHHSTMRISAEVTL